MFSSVKWMVLIFRWLVMTLQVSLISQMKDLIYFVNLTFVHFPIDHTKKYASSIHFDSSLSLTENKNVTLFTPIYQVIAKIIIYNIVPSPDEFDHARGCTSILIYCIICFVPVNLPKLIFEIITGPNLASNSLLACYFAFLSIGLLIFLKKNQLLLHPLFLYLSLAF